MKALIAILDNAPVATILTVIGAVVGGVVVITHPETLNFSDYIKDLGILAGGSGLLGLARANSGKGTK